VSSTQLVFTLNPLLGQLKTTLFERFCMNQRLRGIINTFGLNLSLDKLVTAFTQHFGSKEMGTLMSDMKVFERPPHTVEQHQPKAAKKLGHHISELLQAYEERRAQQAIAKDPTLTGTHVQSWQLAVRLGIKHDKFS
jgi:hypothetical protein